MAAVPGSQSSETVSIPERLASAAFHLEEARRHGMEAAKALHVDLIPSELHQGALFTFDSARDSLVAVADFSAALKRGRS